MLLLLTSPHFDLVRLLKRQWRAQTDPHTRQCMVRGDQHLNERYRCAHQHRTTPLVIQTGGCKHGGNPHTACCVKYHRTNGIFECLTQIMPKALRTHFKPNYVEIPYTKKKMCRMWNAHTARVRGRWNNHTTLSCMGTEVDPLRETTHACCGTAAEILGQSCKAGASTCTYTEYYHPTRLNNRFTTVKSDGQVQITNKGRHHL